MISTAVMGHKKIWDQFVYSAVHFIRESTSYEKMRLLVTIYMIYNYSLSCLLPPNTCRSMQSYIVQSKMQPPGEWVTELEITAASCLLNTTVCVLTFTGKINEWALYSPHDVHVLTDLHQEECIFIKSF